MPAGGIPLTPETHLMSTPEILRLARIFVQQGITKIRLTGGEPTVRSDLVDIVAGLNALRPLGLKTIGMTTNGIALKRKLPALAKLGLDHLNISIDTLRPERFETMTRRKGLSAVMESIRAATELPFNSVKLNMVAIKGTNDDEIVDFVRLTENLPIYVRFIEYMPFDGNKWNSDKFISYKDMLKTIQTNFSEISKPQDEPNDTSKSYHAAGHIGKFGFITSMSDHFCGSCNRLRLLADGNLKVCLFGNAEVNLLRAMRNHVSEDDMVHMIAVAVRRKKKQHAERQDMIAIGSGASRYMHRWVPQAMMHSHQMDNAMLRMPASTNWCRHKPVHTMNKNFLNGQLMRAFTTTSSVRSQKQSNGAESYTDSSHEIRLTHVDETGRASMVDVGHKLETKRTASASGRVLLGPYAFDLVRDNKSTKGDVLTVAQIAGIQAAKQTSIFIPLCHTLLLSKIKVEFELDEANHAVDIVASVTCVGRTGVEMEAMMAVSVAACTVYDMCKAVDKGIVISNIRLISKSGGKSGDYVCSS